MNLALGSGNLEVIGPMLSDGTFLDDVTETFCRAGVLERLVLHDGFSPDEIERISMGTRKRWSLSFIDGDHEGDAPVRDAEMVARFAPPGSMPVRPQGSFLGGGQDAPIMAKPFDARPR